MGLVYHAAMRSPSARQALLFAAGGVPLALPLSVVRSIAPAEHAGGEVRVRGTAVRVLSVARALALAPGPSSFALLLEAEEPGVLLVDEMRGVGDLAQAEVFRLPARTVEVHPAPFTGAILLRGTLYLEIEPASLRDPPPEPRARPVPVASHADLLPSERELLCERGGVSLAVPLGLLVQVVDAPRLFPVPLAPPGHRGVLYHGRALHPVFDAAAVLGDPEVGDPRVLLLLDAGGSTAGILVDRVRGSGEGQGGAPPRRPPWDELLSPGRS
jgi:chemotaxis signal transduction protein